MQVLQFLYTHFDFDKGTEQPSQLQDYYSNCEVECYSDCSSVFDCIFLRKGTSLHGKPDIYNGKWIRLTYSDLQVFACFIEKVLTNHDCAPVLLPDEVNLYDKSYFCDMMNTYKVILEIIHNYQYRKNELCRGWDSADEGAVWVRMK